MTDSQRKPLTLHRLHEMHRSGEKIAMLTCYDASFARMLDAAGVDCLLVGDSLGMVVQGHASTVPVTLQQMAYHTECVARGNRTAWIVGDLPFGSYQQSREQALHSAATLMQAGAHMVKLEGGGWTADTVRFLVERGIPVCAHLGLTPQSVHALGGFRVQGRDEQAAVLLQQQAQ
jgi:3-methyl-2-oxobutanoate hydroxymethyltransferase